jgi:hypothetical protein
VTDEPASQAELACAHACNAFEQLLTEFPLDVTASCYLAGLFYLHCLEYEITYLFANLGFDREAQERLCSSWWDDIMATLHGLVKVLYDERSATEPSFSYGTRPWEAIAERHRSRIFQRWRDLTFLPVAEWEQAATHFALGRLYGLTLVDKAWQYNISRNLILTAHQHTVYMWHDFLARSFVFIPKIPQATSE